MFTSVESFVVPIVLPSASPRPSSASVARRAHGPVTESVPLA